MCLSICIHVSVFLRVFFFLMRIYTCEQSVIWHPWTKCFQCQHTQLHWAVSHKEASHAHGKGHALSGSSRISSRDKLRRCGVHSSRGSQYPQLTNQKVLSHHWPFYLGISKIPVWEPQDLPRNAPRNYLETSALSSCMRKWSSQEIKAFCLGFTSGRLNHKSKSIFFESQGNDYGVGSGRGSTPTLQVADTDEMVWL